MQIPPATTTAPINFDRNGNERNVMNQILLFFEEMHFDGHSADKSAV
jgi:hypothetical protein